MQLSITESGVIGNSGWSRLEGRGNLKSFLWTWDQFPLEEKAEGLLGSSVLSKGQEETASEQIPA